MERGESKAVHLLYFQRLRLLLLAAALFVLGGCARVALQGAREEATVPIQVYSEAWHTVLVLPEVQGVEEWSYGERRWFMEGHNSLWRAPRVLLWRGTAVVLVTHAKRPYYEREPRAVGRVWTLRVSPEGLERMRSWLEKSRASAAPLRVEGENTWYAARRPYNGWHSCNHYIAQALRAGGVRVHPRGCWRPQGLWRQLDRVQQHQKLRYGIINAVKE